MIRFKKFITEVSREQYHPGPDPSMIPDFFLDPSNYLDPWELLFRYPWLFPLFGTQEAGGGAPYPTTKPEYHYFDENGNGHYTWEQWGFPAWPPPPGWYYDPNRPEAQPGFVGPPTTNPNNPNLPNNHGWYFEDYPPGYNPYNPDPNFSWDPFNRVWIYYNPSTGRYHIWDPNVNDWEPIEYNPSWGVKPKGWQGTWPPPKPDGYDGPWPPINFQPWTNPFDGPQQPQQPQLYDPLYIDPNSPWLDPNYQPNPGNVGNPNHGIEPYNPYVPSVIPGNPVRP